MPTDSFQIMYAPSRITAVHDLGDAGEFCDWLKGFLTSAGWTPVGPLYAQGHSYWPLIGHVDPPLIPPTEKFRVPWNWWFRPVAWWGGQGWPFIRFSLYDPYRDDPIPAVGVIWVEWGTSDEETVANLAEAFSANTDFWSTPTPGLGMTHVAKYEGTEYNDYPYGAAGYRGIMDTPKYAGWKLRCAANGASQYEIWMQEAPCADLRSWQQGALVLTPKGVGGSPSYSGWASNPVAGLRCIANPYQLCILSDRGDLCVSETRSEANGGWERDVGSRRWPGIR